MQSSCLFLVKGSIGFGRHVEKERRPVSAYRLAIGECRTHQAGDKSEHFVKAKLRGLLNLSVFLLNRDVVATVKLRLNVDTSRHHIFVLRLLPDTNHRECDRYSRASNPRDNPCDNQHWLPRLSQQFILHSF